jgi:hypothetical protein
MEQFAFRVPDETLDSVEAYADENGISRSEAGRKLLALALENRSSTDENVRQRAEYERRIEELERELKRAQRERRQIVEQRQENKELARYAETQRETEQRRRERRDAPVWRRAKWWVFGRGGDATA